MIKTWNEQSSGWMVDASAYTGFHKALAQKIIPHLKPDDELCDVGCGLGRLDFELASFVSRIDAIDMSEYAISALNREIERTGVKNISACHGDATTLERSFDIILMSLYGAIGTEYYLKHCNRKVIRITGAGNSSGLYPAKHRRTTKNAVPIVQDELARLGISYELELCSFEFGQPLRAWDDAVKFVLSNAPEAEAYEIDEFLNDRIIHTEHDDFPYYLPYVKELGLFIINPLFI